MNIHVKRMHLLPVLALSLTLATAASVQAQDTRYQRSSGPAVSLQLSFGNTPHWVGVRGTSVRQIRRSDRSDYDVFRYGRNYYTYNNQNDRWYMSRRYNGRFFLIDDRQVPGEFRRIPRDNWRNYPSGWDNSYGSRGNGSYGSHGNGSYGNGTSGTFTVSFGSSPHWTGISGSRVQVIPYAERPNYDVFRYGGSYYVYNNNQWYSSNRESGQFNRMDERNVPNELSQVPRGQWRNYPSTWDDRNGNVRRNN